MFVLTWGWAMPSSFFFSSRRRHTRSLCDWSSDVCSSDLDARVKTVLSPAWTTDWMSQDGRRKLKDYGIAPPAPRASRRALFGVETIACPQCGSADTEKLAEFGSTACKALWRCQSCREPFDHFKCI